MSKRYTKQDKIDILRFSLKKNPPAGKFGRYTGDLSKAKVGDIDNLLLKHNIVNLDEIWIEILEIQNKYKQRIDAKRANDTERIKQDTDIKKLKEDFELKMINYRNELEEKKIKQQQQYDALPEEIKQMCEMKKKYELYTDTIQGRWSCIKSARQIIEGSRHKSPLDEVKIIGGEVYAVVRGVNIIVNYMNMKYGPATPIYRLYTTHQIIDQWENGLITYPSVMKRKRTKKLE